MKKKRKHVRERRIAVAYEARGRVLESPRAYQPIVMIIVTIQNELAENTFHTVKWPPLQNVSN